MRNAKKTLSLVMVAIFTTFIVLSGIPAGAVTSAAAKTQVTKATAAVVKVEKTVKVTTFVPATAQAQLTVATKEVAKVNKLGKTYKTTYLKLVARYQAVSKKITARKLAIANLAKTKMFTDADKAVTAAEKATNPDEVDLVADAAALATAQGAITNALELIVKLDKNSANYKGLMARVDAANGLIVKAMEDITAAEEAAKIAAEAKAKLEAAIAAAETAVKAVEAAPLATAADLAAALELGKTAATAVTAVTDTDAAAAFAARLKVVADKGLALQAKLAADAKALEPATVLSVVAADGTITVTFDKKPLTTVAAVDFTVTRTITTVGAVTTSVVVGAITVVSDTAISFTVPAVTASATEQSVVYTVKYTTGTAVSSAVSKIAATPALAATASATSLREVIVTFNQAVDATTAEDTANYAGVTATDATLGADGKTVTLTVNALAQQTAYTLTITGVKSAVNALAPTVTATFTALDITLPTVVSVKLTGPKELTLTFSEIMNTVGTAVLDGGANYVTVPSAAINAKTLKLQLGTTLAAGTHSIVLANFADQSGLKTASQTITFDYALDATLPTVTLTSATQTSAVFTFSKPVVMGSGFSVYHSFNKQSAYVGTATLAADGVTLNVTFATPIAAGNVTFYVNNATDTTALVDGWGNKLVTASLTTAVVADVTNPTAIVTSTSNTTFKVVYSKVVDATTGTNGALNPANYTVKNAAGTAVTVTVAHATPATPDNKTFILTVAQLNGGSCSVTIANVNDTALTPNKIVTTTQVIAVTDTVAPTATVVFAGSKTALATGKIVVKYSEAMNAAKVADKTNYVYSVDNGATFKALTADDTLVVAADGKSATITLASVQFNATDASNQVKFGPLTDLTGNAFTGYPVGGLVVNGAVDTLTIVSAKTISKTQIAVTLSQPITNAAAADFLFVDNTGATLSPVLYGNVASITTNADGEGVITFTLSGSLTTDNKYGTTPAAISIATVAAPTVEKSVLGATLTPVTTTSAIVVTDGIAPTVTTATLTSPTAITLTMSETMNVNTFAPATLNGFSVANGTLTSITVSGNTIVLHGTDFTTATTVSYNSIAGLTDNANFINADADDNSLATFTGIAVE